jgi:hypothetical protein
VLESNEVVIRSLLEAGGHVVERADGVVVIDIPLPPAGGGLQRALHIAAEQFNAFLRRLADRPS